MAPNENPRELEDTDFVVPPDGNSCRWVDVVEADVETLAMLQSRFGFNPLEIEDCASFELRSKIEEYPDHLFIVLHTFTVLPEEPGEIQIHEFHAFVGDNFLVTVHDNPVPAAEAVWHRAASDPSVLGRGTGWVLYLTADAMVDQIFPVLAGMTSRLEEIEEALLDGQQTEMTEIFHVKRTLVGMRRIARGMRDVIATLSRRSSAPLSERTALYFRDVYDHILRCVESIEEAQALAENAMDTYQTMISNRTNDIIRRLTIFSVIFLPLSFITGFWGQNFDALPMDSDWAFALTMGTTLALPASLLLWFWRRRLL